MPYRLSVSLLNANFAHLASEMLKADATDWIHIDVMDGHFVPNLTIGPPVVQSLSRLPHKPFDVHLMIENPSQTAIQYLDAGAHILTIHVESDTQKNIIHTLERIRARGARPGITVRPETDLSALIPFLPFCDLLLIMTVSPGFGGQSFLSPSPDRIQEAKMLLGKYNPTCFLEVDGGINAETLPLTAHAGANVFVVGSAIFEAEDIPARVDAFKRLIASFS